MTEVEKIKEEWKEEDSWKKEYHREIIAYSSLTVFLVQVLHKKYS